MTNVLLEHQYVLCSYLIATSAAEEYSAPIQCEINGQVVFHCVKCFIIICNIAYHMKYNLDMVAYNLLLNSYLKNGTCEWACIWINELFAQAYQIYSQLFRQHTYSQKSINLRLFMDY